MTCREITNLLGSYLDGELSRFEAKVVREHVMRCARCRGELASIESLALAIAHAPAPQRPSGLWQTIEAQLARPIGADAAKVGVTRPFRLKRVAAIIVFALLVGTGFWVLRGSDHAAQAATIDFGVLLDTLPLDPPKAFYRFLTLYGAVEIKAAQAHEFASRLDFEIPATLPGGFERMAVYGLRFGDNPGVATRYERDGEFLAAIFHPAVHPEQFGTHQDYPCVVGDHHGHKVSIGEWHMVHLTDPGTCHCLLSRLDEVELSRIFKAVAPRSVPVSESRPQWTSPEGRE